MGCSTSVPVEEELLLFPSQREVGCEGASQRGDLESLIRAHERGEEWDSSTCLNAAKGGHILCLSYAHENGCPWDESVSHAAALRASSCGDMSCLVYAHEKGCPWDRMTSLLGMGDRRCLLYLKRKGCPLSSSARIALVRMDPTLRMKRIVLLLGIVSYWKKISHSSFFRI